MIHDAGGLSPRWVPAVVVMGFAAQLTLALAVIPPWQNPDEPQHLMTARLIMAHGAGFVLSEDTDARAERDVLASMARHRWWVHYGLETPDPLPASFAEGPARVVKDYFGPPGGGSRLYYRGLAALFAATGVDDVVRQLYVTRVLAAVISILTLICVWCATRVWLDERAAIVVTTLLAVHPQFIIVSTTASPDAAVNLAAAVFWWGMVSILQLPTVNVQLPGTKNQNESPKTETQTQTETKIPNPNVVMPFAAMWVAAIAALLIRRMGASLPIVASVVTFVLFARLFLHGRDTRRAMAVVAGLVAAVAVVGFVTFWLAPDDVALAGRWLRFDAGAAARSTIERADQLPAFLASFFESFWLSAGWLRYRAPAGWYAVLAVVTAAASAGLLVRRTAIEHRALAALARRVAQRRDVPVDIVLTAVSMMALQVAAVVAYYFGLVGVGPQGRYLFPIMPAIASLLWVGVSAWAPRERRTAAAIAVVTLAVAFNLAAWTSVILPAYLGDITAAETGV